MDKRNNKCYEDYNFCRVYDKVLRGENKSFSPRFFETNKEKKIKVIVKYYIEEILKFSPEEALRNVTYEMLERDKLKCVLKYIKKAKPAEEQGNKTYVKHLIYFVYPFLPKDNLKQRTIKCYKEILAGERNHFPKNYFKSFQGEQRAKLCFDYLWQDILKIKKEDIVPTFIENKKQGLELIKKYKLGVLLQILYYSVQDMIYNIYPELENKE